MLLPLLYELADRRMYLGAVALLEQLTNAAPHVKIFSQTRQELSVRIARELGLRHSTQTELSELELRLIRVGGLSWQEPNCSEQERHEAFDRLRTSPLVCGSCEPSPGARMRAEGGRRLITSPSILDDDPLVSVITVCYNAGPAIEEALRSVQAQTYRNVEHIVIDGGSTDGTVDVLRRQERQIDYFASERDNGIYAAMNKGLRLARGKYIALLNADDRLYPEFISRSLERLRSSDADISFCDYETESGTVEVLYPHAGILFSQLNIKHNTFLFHRRCFEVVGGFDESRKYVADARWNRAAFLSGLKFVKTRGAFVFYSTQGASSSNDQGIIEPYPVVFPFSRSRRSARNLSLQLQLPL